ncbi:MAG TPA: hypothetical protein VGC44_07130 [Longimicrobiales bacterium]
MMRASLVLLALVAVARPVAAQTEDHLRIFFEGKPVKVKIDMPGADDGVDVFPGRTQTVDFPKHASRLKQYGTALKRGDEVMITKIKVKKDMIEFQLGGGGYGTFLDDASSDVYVGSAAKTQREKNLEKEIEKETDAAKRKKLVEERDALRKEREREDARNRAEAEQAKQLKENNIRQRRLEGGSRFNIRYERVIPGAERTPEAVMNALAEYVDFSTMSGQKASTSGPPAASPASKPGELRKGLTADEVDALLGRPESISQRNEGTLKVSTSTYRRNGQTISAEFVEGVLIRYTIQSQ